METRTVKIYETTADMVKRISEDCLNGSNMSQVLSKAVLDYALSLGYLHTKSGLIHEGDNIRMGDGVVSVKSIEKDIVVFSDSMSATRTGRAIWNLERVDD